MRLFVGNLPLDTSPSELFDLFGRYGKITRLALPLHPVTHRVMGFALIVFYDRKHARRAARELEGFPIRGRLIRIEKRRHPPHHPRAGRQAV